MTLVARDRIGSTRIIHKQNYYKHNTQGIIIHYHIFYHMNT